MSKARDLAGLFNLNPTSGTTAQRPATADVGDIYYNGTTGKTEIYTTTGWKEMASGIPFGNTAGRPTPVTGQPYFNGETARLEMYTATGWQNIVQETPGVSSISGVYSEQTDSGTITISGTNFVSGCYATAIGTNGVQIDASSTTFNSLVQVIATFTGLSNANEPYDIKVTNPSNLFGMLPDALYVNASPVWQTASGSLGTFNEQVSITLSALSATDSDSTIAYALASGSTLPSGVTLNSATGVISGTLPSILTNTAYNFTINASDGLNVIPRSFSITSVNAITTDYLLVAAGGSGGASYAGGGGAGGMLSGTKKLLKSQNYAIAIGEGGIAAAENSGLRGNNGQNSLFADITSIGGGGGGSYGIAGNANGAVGGSGGGSSREDGGAGGAGTSGQGNAGGAMSSNSAGSNYRGGGGGGAGSAGYAGDNLGAANGDGGNGLQSSITGTATYYAGGGGAGAYNVGYDGGARGEGGLGGGGNGLSGAGTAQSGSPNTGGGGGGAGGIGSGKEGGLRGGNGGSGVLVLAYPNTEPLITVGAGLTYTLDTTTRAGYNVYKFTAGTGTVTF